ncbi:MAG: general secretion pathway protein GspE [Haliangiales bacterium]
MLVRDGCMTETQLEQALARQAEVGGRLGTILIEMGLISADALTVYLGLELGIPIATGATLERAKRMAVALLTPAEARRYRCIPIIVQDRQLLAAVEDPHDMEALDQLYRLTGYRVIPRVAPEIRIFYYLERYYGIPRPQRFSVLGDTVRGRPASRTARAQLPDPPLPGLPPRAVTPAPLPDMRPISLLSDREETQPISEVPATSDALTSEADDLISTLDADAADIAAEAPRVDLDEARLQHSEQPFDEEPEHYPPTGRNETIAALERAGRRGDVASALMCYAASLFDIVALCVVRDNMAFGWKALGPNLDHERIETLLLPLDPPSIFQRALNQDTLLYESPFPATLHSYLYRVLRSEAPARAMVSVISIGSRAVNFLYGHRTDREALGDSELEELRQVTQAASHAYVRLIAASKSSAREPEPRKPAKVITLDEPQ